MKYVYGFLLLVVLLFAVDWALGTLIKWHRRRERHIAAERMRKWNVTAFRGARAVDKNQFLS